MGVSCGSQAGICEFPIRIDTYRGCSHGCRYCFAQAKTDIEVIRPDRCTEQVRRFINGSRTNETAWCDWAIPLHWGGLSDPFQPAERELGVSLEVLELLNKEQYPFIVSTKGRLAIEEPYLSLLAGSNCVVQVSMACPSYDRMELGAPSFEERLEMVRRLHAAGVKRVVARVQPYLPECREEIAAQMPRLAKAGAWGATFEGMKFKRRKKGTVKVGGDWCYPDELLRGHYQQMRRACHDAGMAFLCAENRLRGMGDATACCCGHMKGFRGNGFNAVSLLNGSGARPTPGQLAPGSAWCFKSLDQTPRGTRKLEGESFAVKVTKELKKLMAGS